MPSRPNPNLRLIPFVCLTLLLAASCASEVPPAETGPGQAVTPGVSPDSGPQLTDSVDGPEFYNFAEDLPAAAPGRLVRLQTLDAPEGVRGWRVLYHSTSVDGRTS
ncbi:MAG: hypothetical protein WD178_10760 [Actinomycetota bacterium]